MRPISLTLRGAVFRLLVATAFVLTGCENADKLGTPSVLIAPEYADGTPLWAVAPLRNESGVSGVDTATLSDQLVYAVQQVRGLRVVPLNRTLAAMRASGIPSVDNPAQARRLAEVMGVDAVIVGSVTAWDPYNPPKIGMSLALFTRQGAMKPAPVMVGSDGKPVPPPAPGPGPDPSPGTGRGVDPVTLKTAPTEPPPPPPGMANRPTSTASEHLDGSNHEVQAAVKDYAEGRHETVSALGWRRYLSSVRLYADFACHRMVERLLDAERQRVGSPSPAVTAAR